MNSKKVIIYEYDTLFNILNEIKNNLNFDLIKANKNTEVYSDWITYVNDRPFNDCRYYISSDKLKSIGWSQKKTRDDLINFLSQ